MLCFESNLTKQEEEARDIMVYLFNPVLKFIFMETNPEEFARYGFNSCRQTAIFGGCYLRELLPDYEIALYEGKFVEYENGKVIPYEHAFLIATKDSRSLIVDLSRTEKRLLFTKIYPGIYPNTEEYKQVALINMNRLSLDEMINMTGVEYYTSMKPLDLYDNIKYLMNELSKKGQEEVFKFCDKIYEQTTKLRR